MRRPARLCPRLEPLDPRLTPAVSFRFDYSLDTSGFFNNPDARAALQRAADAVGSQLQDSLAAIVPGGGNGWTAAVFNPITRRTVRVNDLVVGANEVVAYVAAANLAGTTLGATTPGGATPRGSAAWANLVEGRGQPGALNGTDYGPWGGMMAFDSAVRWSFAADGPAPGRIDFQTVAAHELVHLLGFGTSDAFFRHVTAAGFAGPAATAVYGGPVPLPDEADPGHWQPGTTWAGLEAAMTPAVAAGVRKPLTPLDWAALADVGWQLSPAATLPPAPPVAPSGGGTPRVAVGADAGGGPAVTLLDGAGRAVASFFAFDPAFTGGVRVATADFDGDGTVDVAAGTGPGVTAEVRVVSGATRRELFRVRPFEAAFTGGVFVAAGDLTGDGVPELVVSPDVGGGPRVRVFDGSGFTQLADFFGIDDPDFRGGARAAVGDVDGDGAGDLLVAAGAGGGPRVAGYVGPTLTGDRRKLFDDFFAFEPALRDGVYLASGDLTGDGAAEVIVGAGAGGGPRVTAFSGLSLAAGRQARVADFFAGEPSTRGGVRVAAADLDGDGRADLVVGAGTDSGGWAAGYRRRVVTAADPTPAFEYTVFEGFTGGVFVG